MAQQEAMPWEEYQSIPATGQGVVIPSAPKDVAAESRAQTGTQINVSEEARAGRKEQFDYAKDLRNELRKAPESVNYETVIRQFSSALSAQPTPTGDQALITAYAKMLDPGSVVREQEFNTVAAGDSKLGSIVARLNKELGVDASGLIRPEVRNRVLSEMRNLADNYKVSYERIRGDYEGLANRYGVDPTLVIGTSIDAPYQGKIEELWKSKNLDAAQGEQLAITGGERFSTEQDKAIAAAVNSALASGADVQGLVQAATTAGANVTAEDVANFQAAIEARAKGQPATFNTRQSGTRSPMAQEAGELLMTPAGTFVTGLANATSLGGLSQFAGDQVQGLEALNPVSGMAGELVGSALGTAGLGRAAGGALNLAAPGLAARLAGGGTAGAIGREVAKDVAYGGIYGANTGEGFAQGAALGALGSLGGQAVGAGIRRAAPVVGRMLGREVPPPDGGVPPMGGGDGGVPPVGPSGGVPPAGGAPTSGAAMQAADEPFAPVTFRSTDGGSMGTSLETQRYAQAEGLPVPIELTRGAATRDPEQLAFEKEQIFSALGGPLRNRAQENNLQALGNFERMVDLTGAETTDIATAGSPVIKALSDGYKAMKTKVNVAYKRAEQAPEAQEPVSYADLQAYISGQDEATKDIAPVLKSVAQQLSKNDPDGTGQITVATMENIRKLINRNAQAGTPSSVYAGDMKGIIDGLTEGKGGSLYEQARKLRREQARKFESREIVGRLVSNIKKLDDPKVAANEVFAKSILNENPADIKFLRQTMRTLGPDGRQAWKELEGATIRHLEEAATKGARLGEDNNPVVAAGQFKKAVDTLDKDGRLDVIFNPKMAQQVRDLRDVIMYVNTVPPGTSINNSGTARTLMAMLGLSAESGANAGLSYWLTGTALPVPIVTGLKIMRQAAKDNEIKKKIARSLLPRGE